MDKDTLTIELKIPVQKLGGILLASEPTSYTLIRLGLDVQRAIQERLGWSAEVESQLEAQTRRGPVGYRELLDIAQHWAEEQVKEGENGTETDRH